MRARCDQNLLYSFVKFINNEQGPANDESTVNTMVMSQSSKSGEAVSVEEQPAMLEDSPAGLDCPCARAILRSLVRAKCDDFSRRTVR